MEKKKEEKIKEEEKKDLIKEPKIDKKKKERAFPKLIKVTNKGPREIIRANRVFPPYKTTKSFSVNERHYREISAHVGLKIKKT